MGHSPFRRIAAIVAAGLMSSQAHAGKMTGNDLSDMIIQGENRLTAQPSLDPVVWKVDLYREAADALRALPDDLMSPAPALEKPPMELPPRLNSAVTASPWMNRIFEPPVLTINIKDPGVENPEWTFLVKDSAGAVFFEKKGKGKLPGKLEWDGRGTRGEEMRVGFDYTYAFTVIDAAGNPQRESGKPFRLEAFRTRGNGSIVTSMTTESLFEGPSSAKLSSGGEELLTEAKDHARPRAFKHIRVVVYDLDASFAESRARRIADHLSTALNVSEELVTAQGEALRNGKGYRHVELVTK